MDWINGNLQRQFRERRYKTWTAGFESLNVESLQSGPLEVKGAIPESLRGVFYRNGPARHERGPMRYSHRWDGDGMVQAFRITDAGVEHSGRYISTKKHLAESAAQEILFSAFGSSFNGQNATNTDVDDMNVANIGVTVFNNELLALWEAGSAYALDPVSLRTVGIKNWGVEGMLRPFSAHPKVDAKGFMWNFGADPLESVLSIYKIASTGQVQECKRFNVEKLPPIHDFAVTAKHLVFLMPPLQFSAERLQAGYPFAKSCAWRPALGTRVLTINKDDWSMKWHEMPPMALFHIGNAWEDGSGTIRFDFVGARDPRSMPCGWSVMSGEYNHVRGPVMTLAELHPANGVKLQFVESLECEFPVVDPAVVGSRYQKVLCLERSTTRAADIPGWDGICMFDVEVHTKNSFCFGNGYVAEEHVFAGRSGADGVASWVIGSVLNLNTGKTEMTVFDARDLSAGPIAVAELPHALPFGLHGYFHAMN